MTEEEIKPWEQKEGEPDLWYGRFLTYYLPLGRLRRSLEKAYRAACEDEGRTPQLRGNDISKWSAYLKQWNWKERATAWDEYQDNQVLPTLEEAEKLIRLGSMDAVQVLLKGVAGVFGPKYQMMAAKDILDRAGIVKPNEKAPSGSIIITADLLAELSKQAQEELQEWETQKQSLPPTDKPS